jgi:anthranilate synthase component 1
MDETLTTSKTITLHTNYQQQLADVQTPVSLYLKLRDKYANTIMLESSDYHSADNSYSYICLEPLAGFKLAENKIYVDYPGQTLQELDIAEGVSVVEEIARFAGSFKTDAPQFNFATNGLFGYLGYEAVQYFEDVDISNSTRIPQVQYNVFRYVIVIDHFRNTLYLFEHFPDGEKARGFDEINNILQSKNLPAFTFDLEGEEFSPLTDGDYMAMVEKGIEHCLRGDVFQIVLSRSFRQKFKGDDFNVYRALRSINPSPYLFYFDYGNFRLMGSSPEAQLVISNNQANIFPIAGTYKRSGNDEEDAIQARKLADDEKESSEHVMLVDLARNDLSRHGQEVKVATFKEIQFFSHVIHLVSHVTAQLSPNSNPVQVVADTFPAGTLSGAPKHRALQLINQYEKHPRSFYGGAIGYMGFNGEFNHAIMIRSFLSKDHELTFQAGAGVVAKSIPENELQEVKNKLGALRAALQMAVKIRQS